MLWISRTLVLIGLLILVQPADAEKLRLVFDGWPPFTDEGLANGGLATEIVRTALARSGYESDYQQVPWARALLGIREGHYDILVNTWYDSERTKIGEFSNEYLVNHIRLIKRKDTALDFKDLYQLREYPIAVVQGYAYSPLFDADTELQKIPVRNFSMSLHMVAANRVKLALEDEYVAQYFLARESAAIRDALEFLPKPLTQNGLHILVSLKNPQHKQIVERFNAAIITMMADGSYENLLQQLERDIH